MCRHTRRCDSERRAGADVAARTDQPRNAGHTPQVLAAQLQGWELARQWAVCKVLKGEHPQTEHFGAFQADAPDATVPSTLFKHALAHELTHGVVMLVVAGGAPSHCVAASQCMAPHRVAE